MITHILPLAEFTSRAVVDLNLLWCDPSSLVGLLQSGGSPLFNVDGLLLGTRKANGSRYVQVFRDGCVEVISGFFGRELTKGPVCCAPSIRAND